MKSKSKLVLLAFFVVILSFTGCRNTTENTKQNLNPEDSRLNIVFILADDMGWNGLGSYGNAHIPTPNIDRLAKNGISFTEAYTSVECTPTRAEFLSGQYGARTGITQVHTTRVYPNAPLLTPNPVKKLPENNYTVANMLKDAGYTTAISGKWHVGNATDSEKKEYYGFDFVGGAKEKPWDQVDKGKATVDQTDEIIRFIKNNKDRPFFAFLSYFNIHTPLQAPDSLVEKYASMGYKRSTNRFGDVTEVPTAEYLAMTDLLDSQVGKLQDSLQSMGLDKNTVVIFTSDNGALNRAWDNAPLRGAKGLLYEGGIRVPLIVSYPNLKSTKSECSVPVHLVDMFPTFMDLAEGTTPDDKVLDGESILPLISGNSGLKRENIYWHHPHYIHDYGKTPSSAIRKGDYKLIYYYGDYLDTDGFSPVQDKPYGKLILGERVELFDIKADAGELDDLSIVKPQLADSLLSELKNWLNSVNAKLPTKNENPDLDNWFKYKAR
ncbi:sulfatase [uncultured Draconibacterium sp.]|uniref:sulfatase n=1 Tax=uncultured Draconibacterium sp. TaxID=1573823 RepID=UPI0029C82639|nr:sulfatase [uncultured Draconibacterium sp.]